MCECSDVDCDYLAYFISPSGAVLPALLAICDMLPSNNKPSGVDLLMAFNVGIEIQGRLMRFSNEAHNIPKR